MQSAHRKAQLQALSYDQRAVGDAAVTFIVCGLLDGYRGLSQALQPALDQGTIDTSLLDTWVTQASQAYADNPASQRDEAIRSASFAAMTLMLAAEDMGLGSGPVGGFDKDAVADAFALSDEEIPVLLVTVGEPDTHGNNLPQKPRKPIEAVSSVV